MSAAGRIPLLVIGGPTATGKTAAAVEIAARRGGEIVSADSMQIYRDLDIGTAKPTAEERARARFHLVDIVDAFATYTVADFQRDARAAIADIAGRGKLPILCGGTGLYLRAVLDGLFFPPGATPETQELRRRLEAELAEHGAAALHARLAHVDPAAAARLPVNDVRRVIRALEVYEFTGRPMSEVARVDGTRQVNYNAATFVLTCPRELLYRRIEERLDAMVAAGWLAEVRGLRDRGLTLNHQCLQALGYRHLIRYLTEGGDFAETVDLAKRDTRRFAKRQLTWFRREPWPFIEWGDRQSFAAAMETLDFAVSRLLAGDDADGDQGPQQCPG